MLKNISNLGSVLHKSEQKAIKGGRKQMISSNPGGSCSLSNLCPTGQMCICSNDDCTSGSCQYT